MAFVLRLGATVARRSTTVPQFRALSTSVARRAADPYPLPLQYPHLAEGTGDKALEEEFPLPEPLDRTNESEESLRARLVYQTRKRGTLETDLLLSTFARDELQHMNVEELKQFDKVSQEPPMSIGADSCSTAPGRA